MEKRVFEKDRQVCAYLAEQANWLLGRIETAKEDYRLKKQKPVDMDQKILNAKTLIAESLGFISVICRDGATEKQLIEFQKYGERMNAAVRF